MAAWQSIKDAIYEVVKISTFAASIIVFVVSIYFALEEKYLWAYLFLMASIISWLISRINFKKFSEG